MRKIFFFALLLVCCRNIYSQSAGWQWVNSKEVTNWEVANTSLVIDNNCNLFSLSLYQKTYGDTLISKFSKEGKCIAAAIIPGKYTSVMRGKIKLLDSVIKVVVQIEYSNTLIFGKDTIMNDYQIKNIAILYIELNAKNLKYIKAKKIVQPDYGNVSDINLSDFEIQNNSIVVGASFGCDTVFFCDSSYFTQPVMFKRCGLVLKYDTEKEKIEWKKLNDKADGNNIGFLCKKGKDIITHCYANDLSSINYYNFGEIIDSNGLITVHKDFKFVNVKITKIVSNNNHIYGIGEFTADTASIDNIQYFNDINNNSFLFELDNKLNIKWLKTCSWILNDLVVDEKNMITVLGEFRNAIHYQNYSFQNPLLKQYRDADFEMFFMRLDSVGNLIYIEHHEVPFHHHAGKLAGNENDIFFSGTFHYQPNPFITYFGRIPVFINNTKNATSFEYDYVARYTVSKLFFNIYLGTCKDSITVEHAPDYSTFNWFLNDTIYIGSGEKIKWNTNYLPGKYNIKVVASGANVCDAEYRDTLTYVHPLPPVNIGSDTSLCINDSLVLQANIIGNYKWNTNDTTQSIIIKKAGKYYVTVYDSAKCFVSDTIIINYFPQQKLNLGHNFTYCIDSGLPILSLTGYKNYLWSTGETSASIQIQNPAEYSVLVTDSFNCKQNDTIEIAEVCPPKVYVPNSFTPNNDGLNDLFKPSASFVEYYTLTIYNKWGELLYTGTEKDEGWNGKYRNTEAKEDVYIWLITWTGKRNINYDINDTQQGTVTLIRKAK